MARSETAIRAEIKKVEADITAERQKKTFKVTNPSPAFKKLQERQKALQAELQSVSGKGGEKKPAAVSAARREMRQPERRREPEVEEEIVEETKTTTRRREPAKSGSPKPKAPQRPSPRSARAEEKSKPAPRASRVAVPPPPAPPQTVIYRYEHCPPPSGGSSSGAWIAIPIALLLLLVALLGWFYRPVSVNVTQTVGGNRRPAVSRTTQTPTPKATVQEDPLKGLTYDECQQYWYSQGRTLLKEGGNNHWGPNGCQ